MLGIFLCQKYYICPFYKALFAQHQFMSRHLEELKEDRFDVWLTMGDAQVVERYIAECILPPHCLRILLSTGLPFLFEKEDFTRELLGWPALEKSSTKVLKSADKSETASVKKTIKKIIRSAVD